MFKLVKVLAVSVTLTMGWVNGSVAASFDCNKARSVPERLICSNQSLSKLDDQLGHFYSLARKAVSSWPNGMHYYLGHTAVGWFDEVSKTEWLWREHNCHDTVCLTNWYWRRIALMKWLILSTDQLGDEGLTALINLPSGEVLISYGMVTHIRNVIFNPRSGNFKSIQNGHLEITLNPERPLVIRDNKGYFKKVGGAFWVDLQLDTNGNIRFIGSLNSSECMSKSDFISMTSYTSEDLKYTTNNEVCVSR